MSERMEVEISESDLDSIAQALSGSLPTNPLAVLDQAIEALRKSSKHRISRSSGRLLNLFARACISFSDAGNGFESEHPIDDLFSPAASSISRKHIAVALARLLKVYPDIETRPNMSQRMVALFDDCFAENLYRIAKISIGDQSFVKFRELSSLVETTENDIVGTIARISSLQDAIGFRSQYLKKINSGVARVIIHPFLPAIVREERIGHFLAKIEEYGASSGPAIVDSYNEFRNSAQELIAATETISSRYSEIITKAIAVRLIGIVTEDFLRTPFSKQASLRLDLGDKKYPLEVASASFPLELAIINDGPGFAFDVIVRLKEHIADTGEFEFKTSQIELGGIEPGQVLVEFPCRVVNVGTGLCVEFECTWRNFDQSLHSTSETLELKTQRTGIAWDEAETADPYSLSPVISVNELVGRADILKTARID